MKVFLDTNVLIDVIVKREQFYDASSRVVDLGIKGVIELMVTPLTYATCVFITKKVLGYRGAVKVLQLLDNYIEIVPMTPSQCHSALYADMPDFEDMLQYEAAVGSGCDVIITRNEKHFPDAGIPIMSPIQFLESLEAADEQV